MGKPGGFAELLDVLAQVEPATEQAPAKMSVLQALAESLAGAQDGAVAKENESPAASAAPAMTSSGPAPPTAPQVFASLFPPGPSMYAPCGSGTAVPALEISPAAESTTPPLPSRPAIPAAGRRPLALHPRPAQEKTPVQVGDGLSLPLVRLDLAISPETLTLAGMPLEATPPQPIDPQVDSAGQHQDTNSSDAEGTAGAAAVTPPPLSATLAEPLWNQAIPEPASTPAQPLSGAAGVADLAVSAPHAEPVPEASPSARTPAIFSDASHHRIETLGAEADGKKYPDSAVRQHAGRAAQTSGHDALATGRASHPRLVESGLSAKTAAPDLSLWPSRTTDSAISAFDSRPIAESHRTHVESHRTHKDTATMPAAFALEGDTVQPLVALDSPAGAPSTQKATNDGPAPLSFRDGPAARPHRLYPATAGARDALVAEPNGDPSPDPSILLRRAAAPVPAAMHARPAAHLSFREPSPVELTPEAVPAPAITENKPAAILSFQNVAAALPHPIYKDTASAPFGSIPEPDVEQTLDAPAPSPLDVTAVPAQTARENPPAAELAFQLRLIPVDPPEAPRQSHHVWPSSGAALRQAEIPEVLTAQRTTPAAGARATDGQFAGQRDENPVPQSQRDSRDAAGVEDAPSHADPFSVTQFDVLAAPPKSSPSTPSALSSAEKPEQPLAGRTALETRAESPTPQTPRPHDDIAGAPLHTRKPEHPPILEAAAADAPVQTEPRAVPSAPAPAAASADRREAQITPRTDAQPAVPNADLPPDVRAKSSSVHDIQLHLTGADGPVDIHLAERAGEVRVDVRTPDSRTSGALREDISSLTTRLEQTGFHAEAWRPAPVSEAQRERFAERPAGTDSQPQQQQGRQDDRERRQDNRREQPSGEAPEYSQSEQERKDFSWLFTSTL